MDERKGILFALATAAVSGVSIFVNKFGVKEFDAFLFTTLKNSLVAVFLICLVLALGQWPELKRLSRKQWLLLAAIGLVGGSIPFLLFFQGLQLTSAAAASFIHKTLFVFVSALAVFFLREKLDKKMLAAAALLLVGNALLIGLPGAIDFGALLVFAAVLFWAVETIISKRVLSELPARTVALGRMGFGSLFLLAFLGATGRFELAAKLTTSHFAWILISSAFLLGYVSLWYVGLKHARASVATMVLLVGSPVTTILSWAFTGQAINSLQLLGITLLSIGVAVAALTTGETAAKAAVVLRQPAPQAKK